MADLRSCSLSPAALAERLSAWQSLEPARTSGQATPTGAVVHYRLDPAVAADLLELIEAEASCCPSLSFVATIEVRIEADESLRSWVTSTFSGEPSRARTSTACAQGAEEGGTGPTAGIGSVVYGPEDSSVLPAAVMAASIGCANPVAVAELATGETVLDLGSGGGVDVLLAARRVGPTGKAYGLDMSTEMLELARRNQAAAGIESAEFLRGHIEAVPLPDASVDVVVSNCVIGLSADKKAVFAEAHRVLRPAGRLVLADVVADEEAGPGTPGPDVSSCASCFVGCLTRRQYRAMLEDAGFATISCEEVGPVAEGFASVIVRAVKPAG